MGKIPQRVCQDVVGAAQVGAGVPVPRHDRAPQACVRCLWAAPLLLGHRPHRRHRQLPDFTYQQRITHFTEELPFLTENDKDSVMGRAVMRRLGWA